MSKSKWKLDLNLFILLFKFSIYNTFLPLHFFFFKNFLKHKGSSSECVKPHALKRRDTWCDKLRIDEFFTRIGNIFGYLFTFLLVSKPLGHFRFFFHIQEAEEFAGGGCLLSFGVWVFCVCVFFFFFFF